VLACRGAKPPPVVHFFVSFRSGSVLLGSLQRFCLTLCSFYLIELFSAVSSNKRFLAVKKLRVVPGGLFGFVPPFFLVVVGLPWRSLVS
jgi:hypothetical protein